MKMPPAVSTTFWLWLWNVPYPVTSLSTVVMTGTATRTAVAAPIEIVAPMTKASVSLDGLAACLLTMGHFSIGPDCGPQHWLTSADPPANDMLKHVRVSTPPSPISCEENRLDRIRVLTPW